MANSRPLIHNVNKPAARRKPSFSRPMKTRIKNRFLLTVVTASLGLILAGRATAQTFTVLHSFTARPGPDNTNNDGAYPASAPVLSSNNLYGTAIYGGSFGFGTVFKVNTDS